MEKKLMLPIKVAIIYSCITIALYLFGPYSFPHINRPLLYVFLIVTNTTMFLGFKKGVETPLPLSKPELGTINIDKYLNILFWISLLICVPEFMIKTGYFHPNLDQIRYDFITFTTSALDLYMNKLERLKVDGIWRYINYLVVLGSPFLWAYTSLAILLWSRLSFPKRIATFFIWITRLLIYICTGTNVGLFDFFLTIGIVLALKSYLGVSQNVYRKHKKGSKKSILIIVFAIYVVLMIFDTSMGSRIGDAFITGSSIGPYYISYNQNSILVKLLPSSLHPLLSYLTRYVSQPYVALEACFNLPFKPTFGFGYSWFLLDNMGPFSLDLWDRTFPMQLEQLWNYDHGINWHTAYCWFANDVSFVGVPLVFYYLFAFFGKAWKRFVETFNLISFLEFMIFVKMIIYISANNQVFQGYETFLAFWILVILNKRSNNYIWSIDGNEY